MKRCRDEDTRAHPQSCTHNIWFQSTLGLREDSSAGKGISARWEKDGTGLMAAVLMLWRWISLAFYLYFYLEGYCFITSFNTVMNAIRSKLFHYVRPTLRYLSSHVRSDKMITASLHEAHKEKNIKFQNNREYKVRKYFFWASWGTSSLSASDLINNFTFIIHHHH